MGGTRADARGLVCRPGYDRGCLRHTGGMANKGRRVSFERSNRILGDNITRSGSVIAASYTLVGGILLLGGIGYAVDRWRGTAPWFLLTGLVLGVVVGFYELAKTVYRR
jgi:F0F1-type ATP synthase assembly protein I